MNRPTRAFSKAIVCVGMIACWGATALAQTTSNADQPIEPPPNPPTPPSELRQSGTFEQNLGVPAGNSRPWATLDSTSGGEAKDPWRRREFQGRTWYYTRANQWVYWSGDRWVAFGKPKSGPGAAPQGAYSEGNPAAANAGTNAAPSAGTNAGPNAGMNLAPGAGVNAAPNAGTNAGTNAGAYTTYYGAYGYGPWGYTDPYHGPGPYNGMSIYGVYGALSSRGPTPPGAPPAPNGLPLRARIFGTGYCLPVW